ncbi:MAG: hypothetical protein JW725_01250 [Candidatus Babeliaceae bacterium]|nr:hypothetical protein [Candidatus Babeliaceae bacterium]
MKTVTLTLITPASKESWEVKWVEINTPSGNRVIQPGHAPTVALLKPRSIVRFLQDEKIEKFEIGEGVCRIERTSVTLAITPF